MSESSDRADATRARAEARFKLSEQRKTDAEKVMAEVEAHRVAEREKTARLRVLRLAKEAADREEAATRQKPKGSKKRA